MLLEVFKNPLQLYYKTITIKEILFAPLKMGYLKYLTLKRGIKWYFLWGLCQEVVNSIASSVTSS